MIPPDLVRARRRGDRLHLSKLAGADRAAATDLAEQLLERASEALGQNQEEVELALAAIDHEPKHQKLLAGLKKLVLDGCEFIAPLDIDAPELRRRVFVLAAERRGALGAGETFERSAVLQEIAEQLEVEPEIVEEGLFGDLKGAQKLRKVPSSNASALLGRYETGQLQGVLLKAVRLTLVVTCQSPDAYRRLFHKLKFRQLLYQLTPLEDGRYKIEVDGPFSLFESVTKYGMALALMVPALMECDLVDLHAELKWGKERKALGFDAQLGRLVGVKSQAPSAAAPAEVDSPLRSEVAALLTALKKKKHRWAIAPATEILNLPGVGVVIPDLTFTAPGEPPLHLEVLGYWSRDAVWRRVEWSQSRGTDKASARVLFAVSSRLRVSEKVLDETESDALFVFKGVISAKALLDRVDELASRA